MNAITSAKHSIGPQAENLTIIGTADMIQDLKSRDQIDRQTLSAASERLRSKLIDRLLSPEFLNAIAASERLDDAYVQRLAFEFRTIATPLRIPYPEPVMEVRTRAWAYAGALGALIGIYIFSPLTRYLLEMKDIGLIIGAPLGAFLTLTGLGYLVRHPALLRTFQIAFGAATFLELTAMVGSAVNPVGMMWRSIKNRVTGGGFSGALQRIALYIAGILILQLAVPKSRFQWDALEANITDSLRAWLDHHIGLLVLLSHSIRFFPSNDQPALPSSLPAGLLTALQKLARSTPTHRTDLLDEVVQEFSNAGYATKKAPDTPIYLPELAEQFTVLGLIEPGEPYKILDEPLFQDGKLIKKGRLTKVRQR